MLSTAAIRRKALQILSDYGISAPPVPIRDLIRSHQLAIEEVDREETYEGELVPEERRVRLNRQRPTTRQRFTLAHELGHLVLYHRERRLEEDSDDENEDPPADATMEAERDREANQFAAELLMPESWIKRDWRKYRRDAQAMATAYEVSPQAMWIRVEELRLLMK